MSEYNGIHITENLAGLASSSLVQKITLVNRKIHKNNINKKSANSALNYRSGAYMEETMPKYNI